MRLSVAFGVIGILLFIFLGVIHEQVHVAIYKSYGIESRVEYFKDFPDLTTYAEKPCPTNDCVLANNLAEAITYPLTAFYLLIFMGLFFVILIIEEKDNYLNKQSFNK